MIIFIGSPVRGERTLSPLAGLPRLRELRIHGPRFDCTKHAKPLKELRAKNVKILVQCR